MGGSVQDLAPVMQVTTMGIYDTRDIIGKHWNRVTTPFRADWSGDKLENGNLNGYFWASNTINKKSGWWYNGSVQLFMTRIWGHQNDKKIEKVNVLWSLFISQGNHWITPTWWRKTIDVDCGSAIFDKKANFLKENKRQTKKTRVFALVHHEKLRMHFFFVETRWMMRSWPWPSSSLRAARFWNLGWIETKTGWIQPEVKRKWICFSEHIFRLKINLEQPR